MKKTMSAAFIVAALALTSACGGGGDRPSKAELKTAISKEDGVFRGAIPKEATDCFAGALVDSDVSDKTLNAIVKNDTDYKGDADDKKALDSLQAEMTKCVTDSSK